jgi:hypothetical protein
VSVTQAVLAVVGATVGSSLLTSMAFALVLRHKRIKQNRRGSRDVLPDIGFSVKGDGSPDSAGDLEYKPSYAGPPLSRTNTTANGYPAEVNEKRLQETQQMAMATTPIASRKSLVGWSTTVKGGESKDASDNKPFNFTDNNKSSKSPKNSDADADADATVIGCATSDYGASQAAPTSQMALKPNSPNKFKLGSPPRGKFSLFSRDLEESSPEPDLPVAPLSTDVEKTAATIKRKTPLSLLSWLEAETVSPFGVLSPSADTAKWPVWRDST